MSKHVIGLGFGDEGKGLVTSWLCKNANNPLVVRTNGGHQAGHTVVKDGIRHVFSSFGSGTMQNVPTYWSQFCTFYPLAFTNERKELVNLGFTPMVFVHEDCPVTTPFDVEANRLDASHGSVGVGFGKTLERCDTRYKLQIKDLFLYEEILRVKLYNIASFHYGWEVHKEIIEIINYFLELVAEVKKQIIVVNDVPGMMGKICSYDLIFEGAQGVLLDMDYGFFPNVTRSNTTSKNSLDVIKNLGHNIPEFFYLTRSYLTRHGNGFMTNEKYTYDLKLVNNEHETNRSHEFQGEFRTTYLDIDLLKYALDCEYQTSGHLRNKKMLRTGYKNDPIKRNLVVSCLDQTGDEFMATVNGKLLKMNVGDLVKHLGYKFDNVYVSKSDDSTKITKWE